MAESSLESYLTCSVCLDIMTEPVSLSCHHSFCQRCLRELWAQQPSRPCPLCRRKSSKEDLDVNFALRELSLSSRLSGAAAAGQRQSGESPAQQFWSLCSSHPALPPLFCVEEARPLCALCEFSLHPQHTVLSGEEAQRRLEELLSSRLQALKEEKQQCEGVQQEYEQIQLYTEKQEAQCEQQIRAVFSRLRGLLQEEEQRALSVLREERLRHNKNMDSELEELRDRLSSVEKMIQELKQQLDTHSYRQEASSPQSSPRPRPKAGLLLDQAKVLGNLGFRVWSRMKREAKHLPVVLDPNTAGRSLCLSEDLSSVINTVAENEQIPDVPERFKNYAFVLGSVGYSSGTHQWDVEVGDLHHWNLGVVRESAERKQECDVSPQNGFLLFTYHQGKYWHLHECVNVEKPPVKIRVKLDFNSGTLTFSDADADHMTPLSTHTVDKGTSAEKLFPCFAVSTPGDSETKGFKICEVQDDDNRSMEYPPFF